MARVRVKVEKDEDFKVVGDLVVGDERRKYSANELKSRVRFIEQGDERSPQLFEMDYLPNTKVDIHAHEQDEIIYVVAGEMVLGTRIIGPGSTVFVQGNTLYSFTSGDKGLRFLNFRPRIDTTFITREEFEKTRRSV
jgi:hypothetical protein